MGSLAERGDPIVNVLVDGGWVWFEGRIGDDDTLRGRERAAVRAQRSYHSRSGPAPWILGFNGRELPSPLAAAIAAEQIGGLILFRDNLGDSVEDAWRLRSEILAHVPKGTPFLLLCDEEGGLIHPTAGLRDSFGEPWPAVPTPRALGRIGRTADARWVGQLLGERLRVLGIHVGLAPCLDLDYDPENPVIASRSFSSGPEEAADLGWAFTRGFQAAKTGACWKHYPGHGATRVDSHRTLPTTAAELRAQQEEPFLRCLGRVDDERPWIMTAHIDWGDGIPASLSRAVIARLTRRAPEPLLITDSLDMGAVSLEKGAAREALVAHNDILLVGRDWKAGLRSVASLEATVASDPAALAALVRARSRIRDEWDGFARRRRGPGASPASASEGEKASVELRRERDERLARLHLAAVTSDRDPRALPRGAWVWVVPKGLAPYVDLTAWRPAPGKRRTCEVIHWVENAADCERVTSLLEGEDRPVALLTLFRGPLDAKTKRGWNRMYEAARPRLIAHLLDPVWSPPHRASEPATVILGSCPRPEGLTALAHALDLPDRRWTVGERGYFPVDI